MHARKQMTDMRGLFAVLLVAGIGMCQPASAQQPPKGGPTPSAPGAKVYFVDLKDGQTIPASPVIHFGLTNMGVAPAGTDRPNSGHHHLLSDVDLPPLDQPIPNDFNHLHFGAGQTEAQITLAPGPHTLQLLLGDKDHIPHSPPVMSERIHVTVADAPVAAASAAAAGASSAGRHKSPPGAKVYIVSPLDGSY